MTNERSVHSIPRDVGQNDPIVNGPAKSARKPVVALVLAVVIVLVLSLAWVFASRNPDVGSTPISSAFSAGSANRSLCSSGSTFAQTGCDAGHYTFVISISRSSIGVGDIAFQIVNPSGDVVTATGGLGFSITTSTHQVIAQAAVMNGQMSMSTTGWTWEYALGHNSSTPLTTANLIVVDWGQSGPPSATLQLSILGMGSYSGAGAPVLLP